MDIKTQKEIRNRPQTYVLYELRRPKQRRHPGSNQLKLITNRDQLNKLSFDRININPLINTKRLDARATNHLGITLVLSTPSIQPLKLSLIHI